MSSIKKGFIYLYGMIIGFSLIHFDFTAYADTQETKIGQEDGMERFLKADGRVLRNNSGKGEIVTLRGTNAGGWQVMESWMCPTDAVDQKTTIETFTERFGQEIAEGLIKIYEQTWWKKQDFDNVEKLNFNVLRLPISYLNLLDEGGMLKKDTLATYDWFVHECEIRDIYVILDLHAAPGSQNGKDHSGDTSGSKLFSNETYQNQTVSLWEQLAEHYKDNPTIAGYDLLNEPEGTEEEKAPWGAVQLPFYDRLYKAIRAIDPDHLIILESIWEPRDMPSPSKFGWENVMYQYHFYGWDGTDNAAKQRSFTNSKVINNNQAKFDVPVLIGEFTLFDKLQSWEHALDIYEKNGWSWTTWTYKTVDYGNWGIYNSKKSNTPDVNIKTDSIETIEEKWSKVDTETSFTKNTYLYDLLRVMAKRETGKTDARKWYQNFSSKVTFRAGVGAEAELVPGSEVTKSMGDNKIIRLTLSGENANPTAITRNVCISPSIRNSVDATGMDYLLINTFVRQGKRPLYITLVDKNGDTWSDDTSSTATPIENQWERVFLDISKATIDLSAIIEIRIGVNLSGKYYFNDIYFAQSYADDLPDETIEFMQNDIGKAGIILDWPENVVSNEKSQRQSVMGSLMYVITIVIVVAGTFIFLLKRRQK